MEIRGAAALITGGGTGVGRATALCLARGGCDVVVNYSVSRVEAEQTATQCRELGVRAAALQADVSRDDQARRLVADTLGELGRLQIVVNCAGTTRFIDALDLDAVTDDDWRRLMGVNVQGPFHVVRAARAALEASGGAVVNVSSIAGRTGAGSSIPYAVSKGALDTLTIALAKTLAPRIRVNAVAPGFITGRWLQQGLGERYESARRAHAAAAPLGRVCDPEDVAAAILSLLSGSDLITGQTLVCDGGATLTAGGLSGGAKSGPPADA